MTASVARLVIGLLALACACPASAADPTLEDDLKHPISPGSLAILLPHSKEPAVLERWKQGLGDSRATVRASAARTIAVSGTVSLLPGVLSALSTEDDPEAAGEEIRALVALGNEQAVNHAVDAGLRLGGIAVRELAPALAARFGAESHRFLDQLSGLDAVHWPDFFWRASAGHASRLGGIASALNSGGESQRLQELLGVAREADGDLPEATLAALLSSREPGIRAAVYRYLLARLARGPIAPGVVEAVLQEGGALSDADAFTSLLHALLRRALAPGAAVDPLTDLIERIDEAWLGQLDAGDLPKHLLPDEREAVEARLGHPDASTQPGVAAAMTQPEGPDALQLRTAARLPRGLVDDLLKIRKCSPRTDRVGVAEVSFFADGRARSFQLVGTGLSDECRLASFPLLALSLSPFGRGVPSQAQLVALPMNDFFLEALEGREACSPPAGLPASRPEPTRRVAGTIRAPKKLHDQSPTYPRSMSQARVQGLVILESVISPAGCLDYAEVLRGRTPVLDLSALVAVSQWRYTPVILDGRPVPVLMTVSVNFQLN